MSFKSGSPFDSIESAHEFVALLAETVCDAKRDVEADIQRESDSGAPRHLDALRTTLYSMEKLELHMNKSRRILNDLRSLRRLLFDERAAKPESVPDAKPETPASTLKSTSPQVIRPVSSRSEVIAQSR
jgi:hypothetical protein